jgi:hypothetical protein
MDWRRVPVRDCVLTVTKVSVVVCVKRLSLKASNFDALVARLELTPESTTARVC